MNDTRKLRMRTRIQQDPDGWFAVVAFWDEAKGPVGEAGSQATREPDDTIRVGPWPTRQIARRHLRGGVRECSLSALREGLETGVIRRLLGVEYRDSLAKAQS